MNSGTKALSAAIKNCFLLLMVLFACHPGMQAQVRLGLLGCLHSSNVLETNHLPGWDTATKPYESSRSGFQLGAILEIPIGHKGLFFQPSILYTTKGRQYAKTNDSTTSLAVDTIYNKQSLRLGYIDIPLNLTYKLPLTANRLNSIVFSAGPYISFFNNGTVTRESLTSRTTKYASKTDRVTVGKGPDTYKTMDMGFNGRVGFELGTWMISAYYSQGLTSFYNAPYSGTFHHQLLGISLGIWLSSTAPPPPPRVVKKDTDKDGVPDDQDMCPLLAGTAARQGCPVIDSDHDGVDDMHDSCKTTPGLARYNGCPIPDTDHDGINDEEDKCPNQAGVARYQGCPIPDRDGDGVNDEEDKCPDTAGPAENRGCPLPVEIKKETTDEINYIAKNIQFTHASDQLIDSSLKALGELAGLLAAHPELHLTIEGHTDNEGTAARNLILSQKRSASVLNYLVKKGIPATRLTAIGMGQTHPIASNRTAKGRAINRRVELKLTLEK